MNDLKLSVSKTKTFIDCRLKFKYAYIEKLPKKERDYHTFGKFCHKVLEDFHLAYINGCLEPYHKTIGTCFKAAKKEFNDGMTPEMVKECFEIINRYLEIISEDKKNNKPFNVLSVEKNFNFEVSDKLILNGMIDRIQLDSDNVIHVADYKTTKNKKYLKNDWFQLLTYAYVMLKEDPTITKIRASYILLRHDFEYITTEFDVPEILKVKDKYVEYAHQINSEKEYPPNPTILCGWCDFLDICEAGKQKVMPNSVFGAVDWV